MNFLSTARASRGVAIFASLAVVACTGGASSHGGAGTASLSGAWTVSDRFDRTLNSMGVTLVDWDGHLANPAIPLALTPPAGLAWPVTVEVTADEPRIYFDRGARSLAGQTSYPPPSATLTFVDGSPVTFRIAIWPDRDTADEDHVLHFVGGGVSTDVPVHVIDQDTHPPITYPITVDFSKDAAQADGSHFFLDDPNKQAIVVQVAEDWATFFDGTGLDPVPARRESTTVDGADGWYGPRPTVVNAAAYRGYLLYATGVHTEETRSTGFPTPSATYESAAGVLLPGDLHRSGALEMEVEGNYATTGWALSASDETWYEHDNVEGPTDFASIAHHEMGHALFFDGRYENFMTGSGTTGNGTSWGILTSPEIRAYYGGDLLAPEGAPGDLPIDFRNHFVKVTNAGVIDPASGLGAFGNEYADDGTMPRRRWIITKLDLLAAKAVGYPLRTSMSPFQPLAVQGPPSSGGVVELGPAATGQAYTSATLTASGGVPPYDWTVVAGGLPPGLELDSFSGGLRGTPSDAGNYSWSVQVQDSLGASTPARAVGLVVQ
jgi:hypothetical protein